MTGNQSQDKLSWGHSWALGILEKDIEDFKLIQSGFQEDLESCISHILSAAVSQMINPAWHIPWLSVAPGQWPKRKTMSCTIISDVYTVWIWHTTGQTLKSILSGLTNAATEHPYHAWLKGWEKQLYLEIWGRLKWLLWDLNLLHRKTSKASTEFCSTYLLTCAHGIVKRRM